MKCTQRRLHSLHWRRRRQRKRWPPDPQPPTPPPPPLTVKTESLLPLLYQNTSVHTSYTSLRVVIQQNFPLNWCPLAWSSSRYWNKLDTDWPELHRLTTFQLSRGLCSHFGWLMKLLSGEEPRAPTAGTFSTVSPPLLLPPDSPHRLNCSCRLFYLQVFDVSGHQCFHFLCYLVRSYPSYVVWGVSFGCITGRVKPFIMCESHPGA